MQVSHLIALAFGFLQDLEGLLLLLLLRVAALGGLCSLVAMHAVAFQP